MIKHGQRKVSQVALSNSICCSMIAISGRSTNVFLFMCLLTLQRFTCASTVTQKVLQCKETWAGAPPPGYLVVGHEQGTDGTVRLHSAHGCIILLLGHKVWGLRLPKVDQRLCPRLGFFHFLLNRWNLGQLLRERV